MSYIEKNVLLNTEKHAVEIKKSSVMLTCRWIWGILGCWLLLIPTIKAIAATISFKHTEYYCTEKRVIEKRGWLNTVCDEMDLIKIENVTLSQSFWGKLFGFGNVVIQGTNRNNICFTAVANPEEVRRQINQLRSH